MSFASVFGQEEASKILQKQIENKRLAHTYLFTGGTAAAQDSLAMSLACALNDPEAKPEAALTPISKRIREKNHPDIKWVGEDPKARSIKIDEIRTLLGIAAMSPFEARWKVFIICRAERMTLDAQNVLLKTLEEPPANSVFCLLVESKDALLETIRSRSFEVRLKPGLDPMQADLESLRPQGLGEYRWDDFFEEYQTAAKDQLSKLLDQLMFYFRKLLVERAGQPEGAAYETAWLEAIDLIYETKDALDANANQKLALTRLAVRLKRTLPNPDMLKV